MICLLEQKPEYVAKFKDDLPLLIVHGTNDNINDIKGSEQFSN